MNDLQEDGVLSEWNQIGALQVAAELREFIEKEALPGTGIEPDRLWSALDAILHDLAPRNRELLKKRDDLQAKIDAWYGDHRSRPIDLEEYKTFLREIGYLLPEGEDFQASTANVDPEIATVAGPQLVVPVMNARYALNAANARWGSLYDALYGTDAIPDDDEREAGRRLQSARAAPRSSPSPARSWTTPRRWPKARTPTPRATPSTDGKLVGEAEGRQHYRPCAIRPSSPATRATPRRRRRSCWSTTACTSRS